LSVLTSTGQLFARGQLPFAREQLFVRQSISRSLRRTGNAPDFPGFLKPFQQTVGLHRAYFTEFGNFAPIGRAVSFQVLEHHLLLLERFKSPLADAGGLLTKPTSEPDVEEVREVGVGSRCRSTAGQSAQR
jgi:hypothetical protein